MMNQRNIIKKLVEAHASWTQDLSQSKVGAFLMHKLAKKVVPHKYYLEMMRESQRHKVPLNDIMCLNLTYELAMLGCAFDTIPPVTKLLKAIARRAKLAQPVGCTTVGLHRDGETSFWRNLDWNDPGGILRDNGYVKELKYAQEIAFPGSVGSLTGASISGSYAVAINAVFADNDSLVIGVAPTMLLRQVLDECLSYEAAVKKLSETELMCSAIFTIVGADGRMLAIERSTTHYAHRHPEVIEGGHALVTTNSLRVMAGNGQDKIPSELFESSDDRYNTVMEGIHERFDMRELMRLAEFGCTIHTAYTDFGVDSLKLVA